MSDTFLNPVTTQTWANGRHIVRCVKVIQETWDVRTFCFMADQPIMFFFKPGQFVTLELEIEGKPVMRSYTISSSPSVPYSFSITVKRVPGARMLEPAWRGRAAVSGSSVPVAHRMPAQAVQGSDPHSNRPEGRAIQPKEIF